MRDFLQKVAKTAKRTLGSALALIPLRPSRPSVILFIAPLAALAEPTVELELATPEAWTGQRIPFFITLRADGTFDGAASFDLPAVPNSVILKVGNPVLGSLTEGDTEYFTQRHEFALFSQANGRLELPPVTARFSHKKGYTGPSFDESIQTKPGTLTIQRPPGSADLGFLVTTDSLSIDESWDPPPGPLKTGAVLKRTIVQRASNLTGIALAPPPTDDITGIRVYASEPEVTDKTERGAFSGERRETITYLVQQPGLHTLPAIRYDWWNPANQTLESKTLPAVSFTATAPPAPPPKPSPVRHLWWLAPIALAILIGVCRKRLAGFAIRVRDTVDPPAKRASRAFLRSCRHNDPHAAIRAWSVVTASSSTRQTSPDLESELRHLHRQLYGPAPNSVWSGTPLADAYRHACNQPAPHHRSSALPPLNP